MANERYRLSKFVSLTPDEGSGARDILSSFGFEDSWDYYWLDCALSKKRTSVSSSDVAAIFKFLASGAPPVGSDSMICDLIDAGFLHRIGSEEFETHWHLPSLRFKRSIDWSDPTLLLGEYGRDSNDHDDNEERTREFISKKGSLPEYLYRATRAGESYSNCYGGILSAITKRRKSVRSFDSTASVGKEELLSLIDFLYGIRKSTKITSSHELSIGSTPTCGGLNAIEAVVLVNDVEPLAPGAYAVSKASEKIEFLKPFDHDYQMTARKLAAGQACFAEAAFSIIFLVNFERLNWKYANHDKIFVGSMVELGAVVQNAYLWCSENSMGCVFSAAISNEDADDFLGFDGMSASAMGMMAVGNPSDENTWRDPKFETAK